jgi:hypothetical protein
MARHHDQAPQTEGAEEQRIASINGDALGWRRWGPYLADRSWGTVREDYSADGNAWASLSYDEARRRAFRWGEDGIAGLCDRYQMLCFAPAFWNGHDDHLKERFFGVTPFEGNHGEDVKDYYFHVDNLPSHAFMSLLYKYPQRAFPYVDLVTENRRRAGQGPEYELVDTGIFDDDRFFDITVEYAKVDEEDIAIRIRAVNRGPETASLHILPTLWFRNTWSWDADRVPEPAINASTAADGLLAVVADDSPTPLDPQIPFPYRLGQRWLYGPAQSSHAAAECLLTDNESAGGGRRHAKDAFHQAVCQDRREGLKPAGPGTKAAFHYTFEIAAGDCATVRLRLSPRCLDRPLDDVDSIIATRQAEADAFYATISPAQASADERLVQRRALAGLLWTKQTYLFDVAKWLDGDNPAAPPPSGRERIRNQHWRHLNSMRVLTMPDTWEYPWFAAWDLAFQCVTFALVDAQFAKDQLWFLLFEQFQHPSGQLPAYEWDFGDLNPPVHAWAVWRVYNMDRFRHYGGGPGDRRWLERCFHKLLLNFTSWVNRVDREGNNVFEGGFLGLDNVSVIDRSEPLPGGARLEQSDATGWMGMYCLNMMRMALELARENPTYEALASKFLQHYVYIGYAMKHMGPTNASLFDPEDGFFYDVLRYPDGHFEKFRVRSLVGLIPLFAVERLEMEWIEPFVEFRANLDWFLTNRREFVEQVIHTIEPTEGKTTHLLTIVDLDQLRRLLERLHDREEFLSRFGIRSLSKHHQLHPFVHDGQAVAYEPAESSSKLKGGNSNWRGPIWFPTSFLLIESLRKLGTAFGDSFTIATPGSHEQPIPLNAMARDIARRLISIFLLDPQGQRPVFGGAKKFRDDPTWRDHPLFYEYFHGDNGAGIGASHQTGWTALVANLIDEWR